MPFKTGGIQSRRLVVPCQIWMLQRIEAAMLSIEPETLSAWLSRLHGGPEILALSHRLKDCRISKVGGLLFSS